MNKLSFILLVLAFPLTTSLPAQTPKEGMATVAGRVTLKGEPVSGVSVELQPQSQTGLPDRTKNPRAKTDGDGRFRLTGVASGQYLISALAPAFITPTDSAFGRPGKTLNVADGENVENVELALKSGAVVAGRITDSMGNPIIETTVRLTKFDDKGRPSPSPPTFNPEMYRTDDRGAYRIWGLTAGRYKVSVGSSQTQSGMSFQTSRIYYAQTFHPDTTDEAQAKIIEVSEGSENTNIDIKVGETKKSYDVSGRVVDAETGRPVAGVEIGYGVFSDRGSRMWGPVMASSDAQGEFILQNLLPGNYSAFISAERDGSGELYSEPSPFAIADSDVVGIEIRAQRGGSISGTVVVEGTNDPAILSKVSQISVGVYSMSRDAGPSNRSGKIRADGGFRLAGLQPGKIGFNFFSRPRGLSLVRIESKGAAVTDGIELHAGEQLNDVRVVFGYGTATLRGQVKIIGGTLPEGLNLYVNVMPTGSNLPGGNSWPVDARGQFIAKDLMAGEYELRLIPRFSSAPSPELSKLLAPLNKIRHAVTVRNSGETQTIIPVDLGGKENER